MKFYWKHKERGQSIPIIAMMIVILFAMVGLSVDVGNTYAEQRNVVRATDAAALAGMQKMLQARHDHAGDAAVAQIIKSSLKSNGLLVAGEVAPETRNQRQVMMSYLDGGGNAITTCDVGDCTQIPNDAKYIKVTTSGVVDTYFARVVKRSTLPVGATAYAAYCAPEDNVFPLAVSADATNGEQFKELTSTNGQFETPYSPNGNPPKESLQGEYREDAQYSYALNHITWRKLFLSTQIGTSQREHQLRLLSWRAANLDNSGVLAPSFTGIGNLKATGIDEAAWPLNITPQVSEPENYPLNPHILDQDEWLYGYGSASGQILSNDLNIVADALQAHIQNRDTLILPIVGSDVAPSTEHQGSMIYRMNKLGLFRIANGGQSDGGVQNHGSYLTVDLAYLGDITGVACLQAPSGPGTQTTPPAVWGRVMVKPISKVITKGRPPIAYQVVLDVSGSMVMDMQGNAIHNGNKVYCLDTTSYDNTGIFPSDPTCNPSGDPGNQRWEPANERRIYYAKDAIAQMIDGMDVDQGDTMRVIAFSKPEAYGGAISPGTSVQVLPASGWSSDKTELKGAVKNAGSFNGDPYLTTGGTPTPQGLNEVLKQLQSADMPNTYNGKSYKRVVVLITDGMANVFLDGTKNEAWDLCSDVDPNHNRVYNMTRCQSSDNRDSKGRLYPINAMIERARAIKNYDDKLELWVVGLSRVNPYGLQTSVASSTDKYFPADNSEALYSALQQIQTSTENPGCATKPAPDYIDQVPSDRKSAQYPDGVYGYVTITDATGNIVPDGQAVPIMQDPTLNGGKLAWYIPPGKLTPGKYTISASVGYKGDDNEDRIYEAIDNGSSAEASSTTFTLESGLGDMFEGPPLKMSYGTEKTAAICGSGRR